MGRLCTYSEGRSLGAILARAQWMMKWLTSAADGGVVQVDDMRAVVGRPSSGWRI